MRRAAALLPLLALAAPAAATRSSPDLGKAEARCRPNEPGPALLVELTGLKDRKGLARVELYPATDGDFLADDNVLIDAGKVFRRAEVDIPDAGPVVLCLRVPAPGTYTLAALHDRDGSRKFGWFSDGVGFTGYTRLGLHKPKAERARVVVGPGLTRVTITMMYRHGFGVATLKHAREED